MLLTSSPTEHREVAEALRQAEDLGRKGMDELRQALMLMHQGSHSLTPLEPGDLERLMGTYRDAAMRIDAAITGDLDGVSAAPRIVLHDVPREALTNVAKHSRSPAATIRVDVDHDRVDVRIESALDPPHRHADDGIGLAGLAHRVAAIGGTFRARPDHEQWVVILRSQPDIQVVGEGGDGADVVHAVSRYTPDLVCTDVRMPGTDGVEATRRLRAAGGPPVTGPAGDTPRRPAHRAVRTRARRAAPHGPRGVRPRDSQPFAPRRDRDQTHIGTLLTKLGARDRAAAIVYAYDAGLVRPRG